MAGALGLPGLFKHLHQGCRQGGCGREGALGDDGIEVLESRQCRGLEQRGEEEGEALEGWHAWWCHSCSAVISDDGSTVAKTARA